MGLFQNLIKTYEKCKNIIGIPMVDSSGQIDERKTFIPLYHMTFKSEICITLDNKGNFLDASRDSKPITIIIPCTESSSSRSGKAVQPHPLCDQLDYLGNLDEDKYNKYCELLGDWKEFANDSSKTKLDAVYNYITGKSIISDLLLKNIFKPNEYKLEQGGSLLQKDSSDKYVARKIGVRFRVEQQGDLSPNLWDDVKLRDSWTTYVKSKNYASNNSQPLFDYLSGDQVRSIANSHPKNINSNTGNAKLFSCNDTSGFTFRGRFNNQDDAIIIDYEKSQMMHQTLKWLINNYGYNLDEQSIVVWAVDENIKPLIYPQNDTFDIVIDLEERKTDSDLISEVETSIYIDYAKKLKQYLQGYGSSEGIKKHSRKICMAIFDAATTGRMGLTFYQEYPENEYHENIVKWHTECSYYLNNFKRIKDNSGTTKTKRINYVGAPSFEDIIFAIYGKPRGSNDKSYRVLKKKVRKQLLECMFGNFSFPKNLVEAAAARASRPFTFTSNGSFDKNSWEKALSITCALSRKYIKDLNKEEISLSIEKNRQDRDYLYGRLLAVADKIEDYALYKRDSNNSRPTNALRLMNAFSVKPYQTWGILYKQLIPYRIQLDGAFHFQSVIDEILSMFKPSEFEDNSPLKPLYLLGYSAQRRAFMESNKNQQNGEEDKNVE